jgi:cell division protein FtsN
MSKDYKPAPKKTNGKGNPFLSGLMVGLLLGISASVGVAILVTKGGNPFQEKVPPAPEVTAHEVPTEKKETTLPDASAKPDAAAQKKKEDRFTFYGILTGSESPATEQEVKQAQQQAPQESSGTPASENYFLQVGAFQTEQEADNAKAKLALIGLEAVVQTANIPDKGILHRVRVGPLTNLEEINKARTELVRNGFNADLIKIHNNIPDQ